MDLDELLAHDAQVPTYAAERRQSDRDVLVAAADRGIARRSRLVRRRRGRIVLIGTAAAAVVGVAIVSQTTGTHNAPSTANGPVVTAQFKTAAQVIDAASAAAGNGTATSAPYWRVVNRTTCGGPSGVYACDLTNWVGLTKSGAYQSGDGQVRTSCGVATVTIDGRSMTWAVANARKWSASDIATMVADNVAETPGRPSHGFYIFKNAVGFFTSPASPTILKQLWKQLAHVPGVKLQGQQRDQLGRTGWRLTLSSDVSGYGSQSILVDTSTGRLLESSDWVTGQAPNVSTIVSEGPATSAPAATPGSLKEMCGPAVSLKP